MSTDIYTTSFTVRRIPVVIRTQGGESRRGNSTLTVPADTFIVLASTNTHFLLMTRGGFGTWGWIQRDLCVVLAESFGRFPLPDVRFPQVPSFRSTPRPFSEIPTPLFAPVDVQRHADIFLGHLAAMELALDGARVVVIGHVFEGIIENIPATILGLGGGAVHFLFALAPTVAEVGIPEAALAMQDRVTFETIDIPYADVRVRERDAKRWESMRGADLIVVAVERNRLPTSEALGLASGLATTSSKVMLVPGRLRGSIPTDRQQEVFDSNMPFFYKMLGDNWRSHCADIPCSCFHVEVDASRTRPVLRDPASLGSKAREWEENCEVDTLTNWDLAYNVWVPRGHLAVLPFLHSAPLPALDNNFPYERRNHRGYVRGRIAAQTHAAVIMVVTHVALPLEVDSSPKSLADEHILDHPMLRVFPKTHVEPFGRWIFFPDQVYAARDGTEMKGAWDMGLAFERDEDTDGLVPTISLPEFIDSTPAERLAMLPGLAEWFPSLESLIRHSDISLPSVKVRVLKPNRSQFRFGVNDGVLVIEYDDNLVWNFGATALPGFNIGMPGDPALQPQGPRDSAWFLDFMGGFLSGQWVGELHDGLHGVMQAVDRAVGPTASAGVVAAVANAVLEAEQGIEDHNPDPRMWTAGFEQAVIGAFNASARAVLHGLFDVSILTLHALGVAVYNTDVNYIQARRRFWEMGIQGA